MDHISQLPESLVHHILCFLDENDVTKTSILSKSWNHFWHTCPVVDFSSVCTSYIYEHCLVQQNQEPFKTEEMFLMLVNRSFEYRFQQKSTIFKFRMHISFLIFMDSFTTSLDHWISSMVERSIQELDLKFCPYGYYYLIPQILFSAKSLKLLKLSRCMLLTTSLGKRFELFQLRIICFDCVVVDNDVMQTFVSSCPSIESLVLKYCKGLKSLRLVSRLRRLKHVEIYMCDDVQNVDIEAPNVDTFTGTLSYDVTFVSSFALKKLKLISQSLGAEQLETLISQASNLEDLEIYHLFLIDIQIKSQSLKTLKLLYCRASSVKVEAPNLLSMEYSSFTIPLNVSVISSEPLNVHMKLWLHLDEPCNLQRVAKLANVIMRSSISRRFKLKSNQDNKMMIHDNINEEFLYSSCDLVDFKEGLELFISSMDSVVFVDNVIQKLYPKTLSVACYSSKPIKFQSEELVQPKEGCVRCCKSGAILGIYKLIFKLKTLKKMWSRGRSAGNALVFL